jgi:hypothetical protein
MNPNVLDPRALRERGRRCPDAQRLFTVRQSRMFLLDSSGEIGWCGARAGDTPADDRHLQATGSRCVLAVSRLGELVRSGTALVPDRCLVGMSQSTHSPEAAVKAATIAIAPL